MSRYFNWEVGIPIAKWNERNYRAFWILSLILVPFLIMLAGASLEPTKLLLIPLLLVCLSSILNFEITSGIFIIILFADLWVQDARPAEIFALFLIISFLVTFKFSFKETNNKLNYYFLLFALSCLPSFINYERAISYLSVVRLFVFFLVYMVISISNTNFEKIGKIFNIFIMMSVLNGLTVIYFALLTGKRMFGFAGVMYVDYAGISLTLCLLKILYSGKNKLMWSIAFSIQLLALIFTQTRNAWISTGIVLFLVLVQFIFFNKKLRISAIKKYLLSFSILFIIVFISFQAGNLNPATYERLSSGKPKSDSELKINTFVTRGFIWITAWNAFRDNPFIGVGLYNFSHVSKRYNTLDPILYKLFVEKVSPHETFLAILSETGIIGFIGFSFFLMAWLRSARNNLKICKTEREFFFARMILWTSIFILISMVMTDFWLQGNGLMLWAVIVGITIAFRKIIENISAKSLSAEL